MKTVTAIQLQRGRQRANVFLDGHYAMSLNLIVAKNHHLEAGQAISDDEIDDLVRDEQLQKGMDIALRFLSYRPRSEAEIRARLGRRFEGWVVESVLQKLKELGFIDDLAFAQFWTENRETFRPRSRRLVSLELRRKGISSETATQITGGLDDESSAYRAARGKALSLRGLEYREFRRRLGSYLHRRGFDYATATSVINRLWQDAASPEPDGGLESAP